MFGIDYAWGRPRYDRLTANKIGFVMRYVSHDATKDLDPQELTQLHAFGLGVGLVFESGGKRALSGFGAGVMDAKWAKARVKALGLPDTLPVYFAVDFDATDVQKPIVAAYLRGAGSVLLPERVGVYGGYYVVKYADDHGVASWLWQTYAWSGGRVYPRAHIYQYSNGHRLLGVSCDFNRSLVPEFGVSFPEVDPVLPPWYGRYLRRMKLTKAQRKLYFASLRDYRHRLKRKAAGR